MSNCYGDNCIEGLLSEEKPSIISLSEFHTKKAVMKLAEGKTLFVQEKNDMCWCYLRVQELKC